MGIACLKSEGLVLCTKFDNIKDLYLIKKTLQEKYNLESTIISHHGEDGVKKVICIKIKSIPLLRSIIHPYIYPNFLYLLQTNHSNSTYTIVGSVASVTIYTNADIEKNLVIKENRGKSGIYRLINKITGKSYVGSSVNLSRRFNKYYNYNHIADPNRNMNIDRALLNWKQQKL